MADRAALWLTYIALSVGGATLVAWLCFGFGFDYAIERMATVMVIACPHALGLAVPLVVAVSTRLTAQSGLLIRDRAAFERAHNLGAALFDKTGTLTEGRFGIVELSGCLIGPRTRYWRGPQGLKANQSIRLRRGLYGAPRSATSCRSRSRISKICQARARRP